MRRRQRSSWPASSAVRAATSRSRSALRQSLSEAGAAAGIRILSLMIFGRLRNLAVLAAAAALPLAVQAGPSDEALLGAYDAYRAGDALKFARYAKRVEGQVLDPWIDYWRIAMRLEDTPSSEVQAFFEQRANTYVAELLRVDWLKVLGKRGEWAEFERQLALYPRDDLEVRCYAALMAAEKGELPTPGEAAWMWLEPHELPDGCARLTERMLDEERVSVSDVWRRARLLFEPRQITPPQTALRHLATAHAPGERQLAEAARLPKRVLERLPRNFEQRPTREVVVLALLRYARVDAEAAARILDS